MKEISRSGAERSATSAVALHGIMRGSQSPGVPGVTPRVFGARRRRTADRAELGRGIDVKNVFFNVFLSWSRFVTFLNVFF